jgi:hypothetical protein
VNESIYGTAQEIAHQLLELSSDARTDALMQRCGGNLELQREVQWLLQAAEDEALDSVPEAIVAAQRQVTEDQRLGATIDLSVLSDTTRASPVSSTQR